MEERLALEQALGKISPQNREALRLRHLDGLSYEELSCRQELKDLQELARLWSSQSRQTYPVDVWPQIAGSLPPLPGKPLPSNSAWSERRWLHVLVLALIVFKLFEFIPDRRLAIWVQFLPLLIAAAMFPLLGQNPFQIKTELPSHKESI